uniref:CCHC-type domain-containing protein n=1 Tax=Aegilops tauschii subsp. strangulata TaxID=200361 RepID=A0A453JMF5_AEGTS
MFSPRICYPWSEIIQMETNGLSLKTQEIRSKRKWETTADLSRRCGSNQHESPWEGGTTEHQDKMNGIITCLVCGEEGHYSCDRPFKDQEHKVICTVCSKNGHWSISCCQQNKSQNRACTRCGEIGHSTSTHGLLSCSSCDEYHPHGECRLSKVKCFICESQDHYPAQCPLNWVLNAAFQDQRENFQAALWLALSKQVNTLSKRTCSPIAREYNLRTRICFTCREEGHVAFYCPQKRRSILLDLSKEFEERSTIAKSSNLSKELEERDPGTGSAKQSSKMKPASVLRCVSCGQEGHRARSCPTRVFICSICNEEGHRARSCPTRVFICSLCNEEGHKAKKCPQKRQKR